MAKSNIGGRKKIASPNRSTRLDQSHEEELVDLMTKLYPHEIDHKKGHIRVTTYKALALAVAHVRACPEVNKIALLAHITSMRKLEYTCKELSVLSNIKVRKLQYMAKNNKVKAVKRGRDWVFNFNDVSHLLPFVKVSRTE